jgi:hypothetical protein
MAIDIWVGAPEPAGLGDSEDGAQASGVQKFIKTFKLRACNPGLPLIDVLGCEQYERFIRGFFFFNYFEAWHKPGRDPVCWNDVTITYSVEEVNCDWVGPNHPVWNDQHVEGGYLEIPNKPKYHITAQTRFYAGQDLAVAHPDDYKALTMAGEGDGTIYVWRNDKVCNPWTYACTGEIRYQYGP